MEMGTCVSKSLCPPTAHHATYTWFPCGSWVHVGRPSFRRYMRTSHPWIRKKDGWWKTPTLEMVSLWKHREEGNGKPPLYFSRVNVNDENKESRQQTQEKGTTSRRVESLGIWTCRKADRL